MISWDFCKMLCLSVYTIFSGYIELSHMPNDKAKVHMFMPYGRNSGEHAPPEMSIKNERLCDCFES